MPNGPHDIANREFFISRAGADKALAVWIDALLKAQGVTTVLQDHDFKGENFLARIQSALSSDPKVIALLSQDYLASDFTIAEAMAALDKDPLNNRRRLVMLRVRQCAPTGLLANVQFADLLPELRGNDATALAEKILRAAGFDAPLLDGLPPPPPGLLAQKIQILHPEIRENPNFAGREVLLDQLAASIATRNRPTALTNSRNLTQAMRGMGGVGKSLAAREYGWRYRDRYEGVWWLSAETQESIKQGLIDLGERWLPGLKQAEDRDDAVRRALEFLENGAFAKPWLLIYDNIEKPGDLYKLTPRAGAHVLITTRWDDWDGQADMIDVDVFEPDFAARFLCERAGRDEPEAAAKLAEALGYLPLALDHAAAFCRASPNIGFNAYRREIEPLLRKAPPKGAQAPQYPDSVYATFNKALDRAIQGDPYADIEPCPEVETLIRIMASHMRITTRAPWPTLPCIFMKMIWRLMLTTRCRPISSITPTGSIWLPMGLPSA